jgi:hypothetical protein
MVAAVVANRNTSPDFTIFVSRVPLSATCTIGQGGRVALGSCACAGSLKDAARNALANALKARHVRSRFIA